MNNVIEEEDYYYYSTFNADVIRLRESTLEGKWKEVEDMYKREKKYCMIYINKSRGTALHVAVNEGEVQVVHCLVKAIIDHKMEEALILKNERGDTALHLAASRGFKEICECLIGEKGERKHLIDIDNEEGETPLFHAALSWQKQTFCYLFDFKPPNTDNTYPYSYSYSKELIRNNGDSILHCAIQREFFDLAIIIMNKYPNLAVICNEDGFTPLKLLATRTSAFESGCKMSWWISFLYDSVQVQFLDVEKAMKIYAKKDDSAQRLREFPDNYDTCYHFVRSLEDLEYVSVKDEVHLEMPKDSIPEFVPPNYATCLWFVKFACIYILGLSGVGVENIRKMKQKHKWSCQLLSLFLERPNDSYFGSGAQPILDMSGTDFIHAYKPDQGNIDHDQTTTSETGTPKKDAVISEPKRKKRAVSETEKNETAILTAARHGIVEMVNELISKIPSVIHETTLENKNILHVAIENRRTSVVEALIKRFGEPKRRTILNNLMLGVDKDENTMLHLAATRCDMNWDISGAALQMMWNIKWFQYVKDLVPEHFSVRTNKDQKTAGQLLKESHADLVSKSNEWLKDTSDSCSVVALLLCGVSFATYSTVPGGNKGETGEPALEGKLAFNAFALASIVGLCFSVTALIIFLAIRTYRNEARDFSIDLPRKLLLGLTCLLVSIVAMFTAFCSGHIFLIDQKFKHVIFLIYAITCLPLYAVAQLPLYRDLLKSILIKVPPQTSDRGENL